MKYRKKPVVIEARQTGQDDDDDLATMRWCGGHFRSYNDDEILFVIDTLEGQMGVRPGDWVVQGVQGEFYPCRPDIFEATYEPVSDNVECPTCRGRTYLWVGDGKERRHVECPDCNGTGRTTPENVEEPT